MKLLDRSFVGMVLFVRASIRKDDVGICGVVLREGMNSFLLLTPRGLKRIRKDRTWFCISDGRWHLIYGEEILMRPAERIKYWRRRRIKARQCAAPAYDGWRVDPDVLLQRDKHD